MNDMDHSNIPALTPITARPDMEAAARIQKFLHLDALPASRLSADDKAWLERYLSGLFESQMIVFRESVEKGEAETIRRSHFQSDYPALKRAYDLENLECRACGDHVEMLERDEEPKDALCTPCNETLCEQQARDHFADAKR